MSSASQEGYFFFQEFFFISPPPTSIRTTQTSAHLSFFFFLQKPGRWNVESMETPNRWVPRRCTMRRVLIKVSDYLSNSASALDSSFFLPSHLKNFLDFFYMEKFERNKQPSKIKSNWQVIGSRSSVLQKERGKPDSFYESLSRRSRARTGAR